MVLGWRRAKAWPLWEEEEEEDGPPRPAAAGEGSHPDWLRGAGAAPCQNPQGPFSPQSPRCSMATADPPSGGEIFNTDFFNPISSNPDKLS